jgi:branched-chain amino acid aminotransferase
MPIAKSECIWMNGTLVPWDEARVHVMCHALHYGSSVFEGIRAYDNSRLGPAVFCLDEHLTRMLKSARVYRMPIPYTMDELRQAVLQTIAANKLRSCYIRPLVFRGYDSIGVEPRQCPVEVVIATIEWGRYLGPEAIEQGVDVGVSSWRRMAPATYPAAAKVGGHYTNSQLIRMEAAEHGYAEGIALDVFGHVSEGSGENLFVIEDGIIRTPPRSSSILGGVTRSCVMALAAGLGYNVREEVIPREALYMADEIFFTGTAAEITPIRSVDRIPVGNGCRGPITGRLQAEFFGIVDGSLPDRHGWLTPVPGF